MKRIFQSATKIVLILVSITACVGFMLGKIDSKDFMTIVMLVLGAYYGASTTRPDEVNTTTTGTLPVEIPKESVTSTFDLEK